MKKSRHQSWQCVKVIADYSNSSAYYFQYTQDSYYPSILSNFGSGVRPRKAENSYNSLALLNCNLLQTLMCAGKGTARIYNVGHPFIPFVNCVEKVVFSSNGKLLASSLSSLRSDGFPTKCVKLWNVDTGEELHTFNDNFIFGFSQDGKILVGQRCLWDVETQQSSQNIAEDINADLIIALSPDFQTLVSYQREESNAPTTRI